MVEWQHSELYHDWTLDLKMPNGGIRGAVTFRNRQCGDYAVWGTIESWIGDDYIMEVNIYDDPTAATGDLTMRIVNLLNDLVNRLVTN